MIDDPRIITLIQEALNHRGAKLTVDGWWGPKTQEALTLHGPNAGTRLNLNGSTWGDILAKIAEGEVGVREVGGNNRGERIVAYQRTTWLAPGAWPWCAAFVCWCVARLLDAGKAQLRFTRPQTAGAWDFESWAAEQHAAGVRLIKPITTASQRGTPQRGDICVFKFSHIGIVIGVGEDEISTIEGNTNPAGGREGDGVHQKLRSITEIRSLIRLA